MVELIIAGFGDEHTALLARAALARLQEDFSIPGTDLAVVTRGNGNRVNLQKVIDLGDGAETHEVFWRTLAKLLFAADDSASMVRDGATAGLAAIGIDAASHRRAAEQFRAGAAALLAIVSGPAARDGLLGVLRGFRAGIVRIPLTGGGREAWERALVGLQELD